MKQSPKLKKHLFIFINVDTNTLLFICASPLSTSALLLLFLCRLDGR